MNDSTQPSGQPTPDTTQPTDSSQPSAVKTAAAPQQDGGHPWVLALAAGVMLALGLVIGSVIWGTPRMAPHVEPFLLKINEGEYQRAYHQVGQEWRAIVSEQRFIALHRHVHEVLGPYQSMKQISLDQIEDPVLGTIAIAEFEAQFANGPAVLIARLRKVPDGDWTLLGLSYDAPLLDRTPLPAELDGSAKPRPAK